MRPSEYRVFCICTLPIGIFETYFRAFNFRVSLSCRVCPSKLKLWERQSRPRRQNIWMHSCRNVNNSFFLCPSINWESVEWTILSNILKNAVDESRSIVVVIVVKTDRSPFHRVSKKEKKKKRTKFKSANVCCICFAYSARACHEKSELFIICSTQLAMAGDANASIYDSQSQSPNIHCTTYYVSAAVATAMAKRWARLLSCARRQRGKRSHKQQLQQ